MSSPFPNPDRPCAGLLLPVSALPTEGPIGSLDGAPALLDWMGAAGLRVWQILPLCPPGKHGSPYNSPSALSGNVELVGEVWLQEQGLFAENTPIPASPEVDYVLCRTQKRSQVLKAASLLLTQPEHPLSPALAQFMKAEDWADQAALFQTLREVNGNVAWWHWPMDLRLKDPSAIASFRREHEDRIRTWKAALFLFETQWATVRAHASARDIVIAGDMPIYVAHDSVDVWANRRFFQLDSQGGVLAVAGCPPDAYAKNGQHWGNPLYDWEAMAADGHRWWIERVARSMALYDALRIDHFIGFSRFWSIPSPSKVATDGRWNPGPGRAVFDAIREALGPLSLFAEDLGKLDAGTIALRESLGLPGMRVLQFGLDGAPDNPNHPDAYPTFCIASTGTHDSPTSAGWWSSLSPREQRQVDLGENESEAVAAMVKQVLHSKSCCTIFPLADLVGLGNEARINRPGTEGGNWAWREPGTLRTPSLASSIRSKLEAAGRT